MKNWDTDRTILLHYLLEGLVVLLAFSSYMLLRFPETTRSFFLLYLISGVLYWGFLKLKKEVTIGSLVIFSPVVILIGVFALHLSVGLTIATVAFVIWRMLGHFHEVDHQNEILLFTISLLIGLVEFSFYESLPIGKYIFIILLVQLLLTIFIKLNRMYVEMKRQQDPSAKKFALWGFGITGAFSGGGLALLLFYPYIQSAIFFLFNTVVFGIAYVTIYPITLLLAYFNPEIDPDKLALLLPSQEDVEEVKEDKFNVESMSANDPTALYILVGIIILVIIAIYFFKKVDIRQSVNRVFAANVSTLSDGNFDVGQGKRKKYPVPSNEIRKRFHTFEKLMVKYDLGRKSYEPVLDWLRRIELADVNVNDVKSLYEQVRYGEQNLTKEEEQHYYKLMDDLTEIAKMRAKEIKKEKKAEKRSNREK